MLRPRQKCGNNGRCVLVAVFRDSWCAGLPWGLKRSCGAVCQVLGYTNIELDAKSTSVRSKETNVGNFLCDLVRDTTKADCCIIHGGSLRSDMVGHVAAWGSRGEVDMVPPSWTCVGCAFLSITLPHRCMGLGFCG